MLELTRLLNEHVEDVSDTKVLFDLASEYDRMGQCAAAVPFYLRAADKEWEDTLLQYTCLVRMGAMYYRMGRRWSTTDAILQDAVALRPDRPEAWYWLAKCAKEKSKWKECLMYAVMGLRADSESNIDCKYPGKFALYYYEAISDWHIRGTETSKEKTFKAKYFYDGLRDSKYEDQFDLLIESQKWPQKIAYTQDLAENFKYCFNGIDDIKKNYSRRLQDMIVLTLLDGKRNGSYLEIGAKFADHNNNTYLLETQFGWTGHTIEEHPRVMQDYKKKRNNHIMIKNPVDVDYHDFLWSHGSDNVIDYLQIGHGYKSYKLLMEKIPFDEYRFKVITFNIPDIHPTEFDKYRNKLRQKGYTCLYENIFCSKTSPSPYYTEDIWVYLPLIDNALFHEMQSGNHSLMIDRCFYHE